MSWKAVEEILYIDDPIRQGVDWGGVNGYSFVADENISAYTFSIALKHGDQTRVTLDETNGFITKSGNYTLFLRIPASQTAIMKKGEVLTGNIVGYLNGAYRFFGTIQIPTK